MMGSTLKVGFLPCWYILCTRFLYKIGNSTRWWAYVYLYRNEWLFKKNCSLLFFMGIMGYAMPTYCSLPKKSFHAHKLQFCFLQSISQRQGKARQVTYQKIKLADVDMTWRPTYYPGGVLLLIMIVLLLVNVSSSLLWTEHVRLTNYKKKWWENDGKRSQNQKAPSFYKQYDYCITVG